MLTDKYPLLAKVNSPEDLKSLEGKKLPELCKELRSFIVENVNRGGGHLASNLGVIELTVALHRVFNSPHDKIIWDVGHQSYVHKILTGRRDRFNTIRQLNGLSGFPKRSESEHDILETGHASTSISAALGIKIGQEMTNDSGKVIVVIGDGALTGGMALEALNNTGHLKKNLIIILNDNDMSISKNVGAISAYLGKLKTTRAYIHFRSWYDSTVSSLPFVGGKLLSFTYRAKKAVKAFFQRENMFTALGFDYFGPINGHDINTLIKALKNVRDLEKPILLHVCTVKGKGYAPAEDNPTKFHGIAPQKEEQLIEEEEKLFTWSKAFGNYLAEKAKDDSRIIAITAAMTDGTGLKEFSRLYPNRFYDVGIAEQHALTFASGLAIAGQKPVVAVYSTFVQRAVDQIIHDIAIPKLPVIVALDRAGLVPGDGETHQGVFDIPIFKSIPGITMVAPSCREELNILMDYGFSIDSPFIIRYPKDYCPEHLTGTEKKVEEGRGVFIRKTNSDILLIGVGSTTIEMLKTAQKLSSEGIEVDVYNLRFIKPIDEEFLIRVISPYNYIFISEEGVTNGGIGEHISILIHQQFPEKTIKFLGVPDQFIGQGSRNALLKICGLDSASIGNHIVEIIKTSKRQI